MNNKSMCPCECMCGAFLRNSNTSKCVLCSEGFHKCINTNCESQSAALQGYCKTCKCPNAYCNQSINCEIHLCPHCKGPKDEGKSCCPNCRCLNTNCNQSITCENHVCPHCTGTKKEGKKCCDYCMFKLCSNPMCLSLRGECIHCGRCYQPTNANGDCTHCKPFCNKSECRGGPKANCMHMCKNPTCEKWSVGLKTLWCLEHTPPSEMCQGVNSNDAKCPNPRVVCTKHKCAKYKCCELPALYGHPLHMCVKCIVETHEHCHYDKCNDLFVMHHKCVLCYALTHKLGTMCNRCIAKCEEKCDGKDLHYKCKSSSCSTLTHASNSYCREHGCGECSNATSKSDCKIHYCNNTVCIKRLEYGKTTCIEHTCVRCGSFDDANKEQVPPLFDLKENGVPPTLCHTCTNDDDVCNLCAYTTETHHVNCLAYGVEDAVFSLFREKVEDTEEYSE